MMSSNSHDPDHDGQLKPSDTGPAEPKTPQVRMVAIDDPRAIRADKYNHFVMWAAFVLILVIAVVAIVCVPWDTTLAISTRGRPRQNLPVWFVMPMFVIVMTITVVKVSRGEKREREKLLDKGFPAWEIPFGYVVVTTMSAIFVFGQGYFAWGFFKAAGLIG